MDLLQMLLTGVMFVFRASQRRLWVDQPGPDSVQQRMWGPAWGCVHVPASPGTAQLHFGGICRCKYVLQFISARTFYLAGSRLLNHHPHLKFWLWTALWDKQTKIWTFVSIHKVMFPSFLHVSQALSQQEKVVMSSERIQGIDHPQTIQDYVSSFTFSSIHTQIFVPLHVNPVVALQTSYLTLLM